MESLQAELIGTLQTQRLKQSKLRLHTEAPLQAEKHSKADRET